MTDIKDQWNNYMELGGLVVNGSLTKEMVEKQINAFSSFLSETNSDYYYNATYLPNYIMEFMHFLECFHKKYPITKRMFDIASSYCGVTLIIDQYWQQESVWDGERKKIFVMHRVHPSYERKQVCDNELLVECSVLCDTKRFIYHNKIGIDATGIQQELQNLEEFLNNKLASHKKEK